MTDAPHRGPAPATRAWWTRPERWCAVAACLGAGFAYAAILSMVAGVFGPVAVGVGTAVLGGGLAAVAVDRRPAPAAACDPLGFWLAAALIALAATGLNATHASEHGHLNRDPAVYVNAALVLRDHGSPLFAKVGGGFAGQEGLGQGGPGTVPVGDDRGGFQGLHVLPALGAAAAWVGGENALARVPAVLGGAFLLALMAFARRVVGSGGALLAGGLLALLIPFAYASRDYFSEMVVGPALFAALWLLAPLVSHREGPPAGGAAAAGSRAADGPGPAPWRAALAPGALLGAVALSRIDAALALAGVLGFLALWAIGSRPGPARGAGDGRGGRRQPSTGATAVGAEPGPDRYGGTSPAGRPPPGVGAAPPRPTPGGAPRRGRWGVLAAVAAPVAAALALALADGWRHAPGYMDNHREELLGVGLLLVALPVGALAWWAVSRRWTALPDLWARYRRPVAGAAALVAVTAVPLLLWVRPAVQEAHSFPAAALIDGLQRRDGLERDPSRSYDEQSVVWLAWYLGPLGLAAATAGLAAVGPRVLTGRSRPVEALALAVLLPSLVLYLYRPSIYPDHPWSTRRYLPVVYPLLAVLAAGAGARLWQWAGRARGRAAGLALAGLLAVALVAEPARALAPIVRFQAYDDMLSQIEELCRVLPEGAVLLGVGDAQQTVTRPVASSCDVPGASVVADGGVPPAERVAAMAAAWAAEGRELWLVGSDPELLASLASGPVTISERVEPRVLLSTLERRPDTLVERDRVLAVARA